jgi:Tfp pilus assembly protein FimT
MSLNILNIINKNRKISNGMKYFYQKGLTVTEILVVVAGIILLVVVVTPSFLKIRENQTMSSAVADVLSAIDKARGNSLASFSSSEYGVHFQSDKVIIFKGKIFSANDVNNESIDITSPASISNVTLGGVSGSTGDVYFNRIYGIPSTTGTVTISTSSYSKIITISQTGNSSKN